MAKKSVGRSLLKKETRRILDAQKKRLAPIEALIKKAERKCGIPLDYERMRWNIARIFINYGAQDIANGKMRRAHSVADNVGALLDMAESGARSFLEGKAIPPVVPRYQTGKIEIRNGSFIADVKYPGESETRRSPVFFTGFGHFGQVRRDIPLFPHIGVNIIQIETGPSAVVFEDGVNTESVKTSILAPLKRAAENNVAVNVLLSPHYFPEWIKDKYPDLRRYRGGFLTYTIDAPQARWLIETHLRAIIPMLAGNPAIHSLCLSNEPVYEDCTDDAFTKPQWAYYLEKTHGRIERINKLYGTHYEAFSEVPVPPPLIPADRAELPRFYNWCIFNMVRFSRWHRWMADIIHSIDPGIPVHAKCMPVLAERRNVAWGVDLEQFAALGQINGNDCNAMYNFGSGEWAYDWQVEEALYDLQRSFKFAPVFNSENHLIYDRERRAIPPAHTYAVLWQGAIHGQCATTIWVWERTNNAKSDLAGAY